MSNSVESYSHYVHYTYDPHIHMVLNRDDRSILLYKISDNFYQTCHVCKLKYVRWWIYIKINIEHFHSLAILDWKVLIDYFPSLSIDRPCQEMSHYCEIIVSCILSICLSVKGGCFVWCLPRGQRAVMPHLTTIFSGPI